jgi:hypothetical protein
MNFKSDLTLLEDLHFVPEQKSLPQLYRADENFAKMEGSPFFRKMIDQIMALCAGDGFKHTSIDTRTHMLMKDMYPCIPGWHCDDFYRPGDGQPDLLNVEKMAPQKHYIVVLGDCSMTEFLEENVSLPDPDYASLAGAPLYAYYDANLEIRKPKTKFVESNKIYSFGPLAFHRGSAATKNGFRTFIRLTRSNHRTPKNELRYQSNVYVAGRVSW